MDPGAIASLLQHPIPSALLILDSAGRPLGANRAARALDLHRTAYAYAEHLADLRRSLRSRPQDSAAFTLPGPYGHLDGWMRAVAGDSEGEVLAYTLCVPEPDGASRWQVALDSAGHGLWDWDIAGNAAFRSSRWKAMLGYDDEAAGAVDEGVLGLVHPDDICRVRQEIADHLEGRTPHYVSEHRLRHRDGSWRWVRDSGRVVARAADDQPLRMVGTHTEIGQQKRLEQRLREQQALLEDTQRIAGMAAWAWSPADRRTWWSAELYRLLGVPEARRPYLRAWLRRLTPAALCRVRRAWRQLRRDARPAQIEVELAGTDGAPLHLVAWAQPQIAADGRIGRIIGQVQDVSAQRRTDALIRWRTELLNRVSAMGRIGGCEIDPATRQVQWTEECFRIHGMPQRDRLTLDEALALYPPESCDAFEATLARVADGDAPEHLELCFYRGNGQRVWVQVMVEMDRRAGMPARFVALFRDVSRERESSERIELLSHYDLLTGLPNRFMLRLQSEEAIALALEQPQPLALLLIDLDRFTSVNETFGHAAGDAVLKAAAGRMHRILPAGDLFGRMGGDEFMVLLRAPHGAGQAQAVAAELIAALSEPLVLGDETLKVGASIGIAMLEPERADFDALLRAALAAVNAAKEAGHNACQLYTPEVAQRTRRRLEIEHALRGALEREEFSLVYQPLVRVRGEGPPGIEALLRWNRPQDPCSPAEFIPIAEQCGEIVRLGEWVIGEACRQAAAWHAAGLSFGRMAVNVSGLQLQDPGFAERLIAQCRQAGWPPQRLELELTESALIRDSEALRHCFEVFERHGVLLAVDDFGTGFSNLSYLNRFPVQRLKIDRSFVADMLHDGSAREVTLAIIQLSHALGMHVVAEGVETPEEEERLRAQDCDEIQGYLYARPLPPRELAQWLRQQAGARNM